jgi:outer membrane receptor protein involved in Fe transport
MILKLSDDQNLRFSYAKTIARPSFKELSYSQIFDPISGRTFIGGLFDDKNIQSGTIYWDGKLTSSDIHNLDLRWELFQKMGQTFSIGTFYKKFSNPIELVQYARVPGSYQPRNVGDGEVYGGELEFRQGLGFLGKKLKNFSLNFNFTYTKSKIELSNIEFLSRESSARNGQTIDKYRDMAGQAPYIINAGIAYNREENGIEAGLYYNVQGETLQFVGIADRPDVYSVPFHSLNFNATKSFGEEERLHIGLKIDNLLTQKKESVYKSFQANNQFFSSINPGTTIQLKLSYAF